MFKDMPHRLYDRDKIFLQTINEYKKAILALQQNENSIKSLTDKVFELSSTISKFKNSVTVRIDSALALVHR